MPPKKKRHPNRSGNTGPRSVKSAATIQARRGKPVTTTSTGASKKSAKTKAGKRPTPKGATSIEPSIVVGAVSPLVRLCGGLGALAAICRLLAAVFPLVTASGRHLGGGVTNVAVTLPLVVVLAIGSFLCLYRRLPRFGLAIIATFGATSIGQLVRQFRLYQSGSGGSIDLPLPESVDAAFRYTPSIGLILLSVSSALGIIALLVIPTTWSSTDMEDDGSFEALRPLFGGLGFFAGFLGVLAICAAPSTSPLPGLAGSVFSRAGLPMAGDLLLSAALAICGALAASLRPRLSAVGIYLGLSAVMATYALSNTLLVARVDVLHLNIVGIIQYLSAAAFALLALGAWRMTRSSSEFRPSTFGE